MYTELHTSSAFSFLDGASLPETLIERAAELGYSALALLDRDGVYGAPQFYRAAKATGIKAIVGAELTMSGFGTRHSAFGTGSPSAGTPARERVPSAEGRTPDWTLPVLVSSAAGYKNLCRVITRAKLKAPKGEMALALEDFTGCTSGLVALVGRPALAAERHGVGGLVSRVIDIFGRSQVWVELQRHLRRDGSSTWRRRFASR
jgi:error-prone DNA polymerase